MYQLIALLFKELLEVVVHEFIGLASRPDTIREAPKGTLESLQPDDSHADQSILGSFGHL
jgi:hypothetical protein